MKMMNESAFEFDEVLEEGFTVIPNGIFVDERLTYNAIGLYCKILRYKNIPGWKVYQSTLINIKNGKSKVMSAMKELIDAGWVTKTQLKDSKGRMAGVKYKIFSTCQNKIKNDETVDIATSVPKSDFLTSEKPTSENQTLINKDTKKERINKTSSSKEPDNKSNNLIKSFEENICELKKTTLPKFKEYVAKNNKDFIEAILEYCAEVSITSFAGFKKVIDTYLHKNITTAKVFKTQVASYRQSKTTTKDAKTFTTKSTPKKDLKFNNFTQRDYDYDSLEKQLLGWEDDENTCNIFA